MSRLLHRRLLAWLLPAALVFAQHGAMAHLVSHAGDKSPDSEQTFVHLKLCGKCISAAKLVHTPLGQEHHLGLAQARYGHNAALPALLQSVIPWRHSCRDPPKQL